MVLMLDLGRPERLIVAATHYNFKSVFAWNVFLYSGMFAIVAIYLWTMFERRFNGYTKAAGIAALVWRFVLTTGTGSIFGFLVARQAYQSALLAPLFIVMSFGWGLAVFLLVQSALLRAGTAGRLDDAVRQRLLRLLGVFARRGAVPGGGLSPDQPVLRAPGRVRGLHPAGAATAASSPLLFWVGYVVLGSLLPLLLFFHPRLAGDAQQRWPRRCWCCSAPSRGCIVFIIGGQAFPLDIFPGFEMRSSFGDGAVASYVPRLPELLLGLGGIGVRLRASPPSACAVLDFLPARRTRAGDGGAGG